MPDKNDRQDLARDWITIWQSELAAASTDRERAEAWSAAVALWAEWARLGARVTAGPAPADGPARPAAAAPSPGPAAAADASAGRERTIASLAARVEELERRLAAAGAR